MEKFWGTHSVENVANSFFVIQKKIIRLDIVEADVSISETFVLVTESAEKNTKDSHKAFCAQLVKTKTTSNVTTARVESSLKKLSQDNLLKALNRIKIFREIVLQEKKSEETTPDKIHNNSSNRISSWVGTKRFFSNLTDVLSLDDAFCKFVKDSDNTCGSTLLNYFSFGLHLRNCLKTKQWKKF